MTYDSKDLPQDVAIHASEEDDRVIMTISTGHFPEEVKELLAGEGIWGAYRADDGHVIVQDKYGSTIETEILVSPDGYVFA